MKLIPTIILEIIYCVFYDSSLAYPIFDTFKISIIWIRE